MDSIPIDRSFTLTRHVNASRSLAFQAWTDPDHLAKWFLNPDYPPPAEPIVVDLRVGGTWRLIMVHDAETSYATGGVYREIVTDRRLVFEHGAPDGWPLLEPANPDATPIVTIEFRDAHDGGTDMSLTVALADSMTVEDVTKWFAIPMKDGWSNTIDRLVNLYHGA